MSVDKSYSAGVLGQRVQEPMSAQLTGLRGGSEKEVEGKEEALPSHSFTQGSPWAKLC